jgi:hypothetical protein
VSDPKKDFFISYSSKDKEWADWLDDSLRTGGYSTEKYDRDFANSNLVMEINNAIEHSKSTLAIFSPDYFKSKICKLELNSSLSRDYLNETLRIIPVKISDCDVMPVVGSIPFIDFCNRSRDDEAKTYFISEIKKRIGSRGVISEIKYKRYLQGLQEFYRSGLITAEIYHSAQLEFTRKFYTDCVSDG